MTLEKKHASKQAITDEQVEKIRELAEEMQYGSINLVFHDGVLVQMERNEKIRL